MRSKVHTSTTGESAHDQTERPEQTADKELIIAEFRKAASLLGELRRREKHLLLRVALLEFEQGEANAALESKSAEAARFYTELLEARRGMSVQESESAARAKQLMELEHRLANMHKILETKAKELEAIKISTSWRFTLPLRRFAGEFPGPARHLRRILKLIYRALRFHIASRIYVGKGSNDVRLLESSKFFDRDWYREQYSDVRKADVDPVLHYLERGASEGRDPSPEFDSDWYLQQYSDVRAAGINPLVHYLKYGAAESRHPRPSYAGSVGEAQRPTGSRLLVHRSVSRPGMLSSLRNFRFGANKSDAIKNPKLNQAGVHSTTDDIDLLIRSQYFDVSWYLANYQDVNEAGVNPISHYLESGAARGLNPSPLFLTQWYMEQNPDVERLGLNPLVHFLRIGRLRGSEPHPFFRLRHNFSPITLSEIDQIFVQCSGEQFAPHATTDDNWRENRVKWGRHFGFRGIVALRSGDILASLREFRRSVQICSDAWDFWRLYTHAFRLYNSRALELFEEAFKNTELLVAHVSCKRFLNRARASVQSFLDPSQRIENIIVIGASSRDGKFEFDPSTRMLIVPAEDSYEDLPKKVSQAFMFLGISFTNCSILKVDDDVQCRDLAKLHDDLNTVISAYDYGGRVTAVPPRLKESCFWHFGKCTDPVANRRPDGLFYLHPYACGPYYWVGRHCVNLLWKASIMHDRYFDTEFGNEDRAIGLVLSYYGIRPHHAELTRSSLVQLRQSDLV